MPAANQVAGFCAPDTDLACHMTSHARSWPALGTGTALALPTMIVTATSIGIRTMHINDIIPYE